uniref:Uncharacterized protein n=1 Tax=Glossina austeni TaxID=7395 RepID=A0A1A9VXS1_GLOAU
MMELLILFTGANSTGCDNFSTNRVTCESMCTMCSCICGFLNEYASPTRNSKVPRIPFASTSAPSSPKRVVSLTVAFRGRLKMQFWIDSRKLRSPKGVVSNTNVKLATAKNFIRTFKLLEVISMWLFLRKGFGLASLYLEKLHLSLLLGLSQLAAENWFDR